MKIKRERSSTKTRQWLLFCLLIRIFFGCASSSEMTISDLSSLSPELVQKRVAAHLNHLRSFVGRARVIIELPGQGHDGFSQVYIDLPDSIFVKTEAILGIDIGALFLDQQNFGAYAPRDNILYYGEVEKLDLRDFLEVELETHELYEVFTGLVQLNVDSTSRLSLEDGKILVTTSVDSGVVKYWVDPEKSVVVESHLLNQDGEILLTKKFERFKSKENIELPKIIRVTRPKARERITVYYTKQTVNRAIQAEQFRLKVPDNARKVYWGDLERPAIKRNSSERKTNERN